LFDLKLNRLLFTPFFCVITFEQKWKNDTTIQIAVDFSRNQLLKNE
jgi:hypothetical protein